MSDDSQPRPLIDWQEAVGRLQGRTELLQELCEIFLGEIDQIESEIAQSATDGQYKTLKRAAHTLKGSACVFCAHTVVSVAFELEEAAQAADAAAITDSWGRLKELLPGLREALQSMPPLD